MPPSGSMRTQIGTLVLATSVIQLANGFFGTFISIRVTMENFDALMTGVVLSSYFGGFTLGAMCCSRIIERIRHTGKSVTTPRLAAWSPLRRLRCRSWWDRCPGLSCERSLGSAVPGSSLRTESWLNAKAPPSERGRVFQSTWSAHSSLSRSVCF